MTNPVLLSLSGYGVFIVKVNNLKGFGLKVGMYAIWLYVDFSWNRIGLGAVHKLRGQDEVGRWTVKCPQLST